jgi:TusA-related sulfurtransferase
MAELNTLNLRGIACPLNFVKAKLALEKLPVGSVLEVILDAGEPVTSVFESMVQEGHEVNEPQPLPDGSFAMQIRSGKIGA